ncbi:la protein 1 [Cornus florida]|uniref:la protein 1 n=1 Tax=Cornus florida TaxID=4283 RepID=UPI00289C0FB2|nr:la protein 1 [Cornus florida]
MATQSLDEVTAKKVIRQVEFYFSDSNLPRDNFLRKTISENEDGLISLALICSFTRMRSHLNLKDVKPEEVSEDMVKAVAETLRTSSFLKVSEDGKKIGRATELQKPEEVIEQLDVRTIAASPLEYDVKLEDVESFFGQCAKVNSVRLPRHVTDKRVFCGTALIEFSAEEDAKKVLEQSLVYAGVELELKPKKDFDEERAKQAEEVEKSRPQFDSNHKNRSNPEENYPKGLIVAFKLKSTSTGGSAEHNGSNKPASDNSDVRKTDGEPDFTVSVTEGAEDKVPENSKDDENPGSCIEESEVKLNEETELDSEGKETEDGENSLDSPVQMDENDGNGGKKSAAVYKEDKDVVLREDLKGVFQKFGTVKYIDFRMGEDSGYIRFEEPGAVQKARTAAALAEEGGLVVKNYIATLDPVTGDAEREYWSVLRGSQDKRKENWSNRGRGGGRGGQRGGRHFNKRHSRSRGNDSGNRSNKVQKVGAA